MFKEKLRRNIIYLILFAGIIISGLILFNNNNVYNNNVYNITTTSSNITTIINTTTTTNITTTNKKEEKIIYPMPSNNSNLEVPKINTSFKTWTPCYNSYGYIRLIGKQKRIVEKATADEDGLLKIENYYLAAMGTYYSSNIGDIFCITTDKNNSFNVILCDVKSDAHTDTKHQYTIRKNNTGCLVEFYVKSRETLNANVRYSGNVSSIGKFDGSIVKVEQLGHYDWE